MRKLRPVVPRTIAQLGASHLRLLAGQVQEHVEPVGAEVSEAATAGLGGIEHPGAIPRPRPPRYRTRNAPPRADIYIRIIAPEAPLWLNYVACGRLCQGADNDAPAMAPGRD